MIRKELTAYTDQTKMAGREFWTYLQDKLDKTEDYIAVGGTRAGNDFKCENGVVEKYGESPRNSNGTRILDICKMYELIVGNIVFQQ